MDKLEKILKEKERKVNELADWKLDTIQKINRCK